jgi:hypothetical protein
MDNFEQAVFISYAWGGKSEEIVNKIDQSLQKRGIKIIRDKRDLGYKGSIQEFMERIGQGNCVIVVISDKYLRSPNCMFELAEIAENKQFHDRIFPVVLEDASIYDPIQRLDYVKHWEAKRAELAAKIKSVDPAHLQGIYDDMNNYDRFRDEISGLTSILKDMNTLTPDMHQESDFNALYESIAKRLHPTDPKGAIMTTSDSSPKKEQDEKPDEAGKGTSIHIGGNVTGPVQDKPVFHGPVHFGNNINAQEYVQGNRYQTGDISDSTGVVLGDHAQVDIEQHQGASAEDILKIFSMLQQRVDKMPAGEEKTEAKDALNKLQAEAKKGEAADEGRVKKYLNFLAKTAPDIWQVAVDTFINPVKGLSTVFRKVAERAKAERAKS